MQQLENLRGVGGARLTALNNAGIYTLRDLLYTMPSSYKDTIHPIPLSEAVPGEECCVTGFIKGTPKLMYFHGKSSVSAKLTDGEKTVTLQYFNQPWMKNNLHQDEEIVLFGKIEQGKNGLVMYSPSIEHEAVIRAIYRPIEGVPAKVFAGLVSQALNAIDDCVQETLPERIRRAFQLCEINFAIRQSHVPDTFETLKTAQRRLIFEKLLLYQAAMRLMRGAKNAGVRIDAGDPEEFWQSLPFAPTGAQKKVLNEIAVDLRKDQAMSRMVQGDVGCGKTAVAFGSVYLAAKCGFQTALMAPTEILARQHLENAKKMLEPLGIPCGLLVGGMKTKERRDALGNIEQGNWQCVIGTHALLSEPVKYKNLGLVVTDEQHRFGVTQRKKLSDKAEEEPNALVMSATPIPRSLALILYGDLDISIIDELPPGRTKVETRVVPESKREDLYRFICDEAQKGHQTYIVCPLVEDSEQIEAQSAQTMYKTLSEGALKGLKLGLTYGSQKPDEKEQTIADFSAGKIDVLVSTTVIEVGVNVPSACVMVIENADRFGLSQLHQLRGRVGRGSEKSWCFLLAEKNARLKALCSTNDGFVIAQEDLKLRGPGDLLGTRQHGEALGEMGIDNVLLIEETKQAMKLMDSSDYAKERDMILNEAKRVYARLMEKVAMN